MMHSKHRRLLCGCMLALLLCLLAACAAAQGFSVQLMAGTQPCRVTSVEKEDGHYLLLPSFADLSALKIAADEMTESLC